MNTQLQLSQTQVEKAGFIDFDVTDFIKTQLEGDKTASIVLSDETTARRIVEISSREGVAPPTLVITYIPTFLPPMSKNTLPQKGIAMGYSKKPPAVDQLGFQILQELEKSEELHGYALLEGVNKRRRWYNRIGLFQLYRALQYLEHHNWIRESGDKRVEGLGGSYRRHYYLSPDGRQVLGKARLTKRM